MRSERVEVSAPGKIMLFGEHSVMYGEACIVTAVDQRITLLATPLKENKLKIDAVIIFPFIVFQSKLNK